MPNDTTLPAWEKKAAEAIEVHIQGCRENQDGDETPGTIARIIAEHAPKVRMLEWQHFTTADPAAHWEHATSVFGVDYDVQRSGMSDIYFMNGSMFKSATDAKAAAQADFERRVMECFE